MPAHPCGRDARAPMRARCPCTRAVRRASGALLRRWVSNASATFNTRRRDRAHRVPVRARCPHTHADGTPAHPCGLVARAPALFGERPARCCGAGYRTLARRSTPGVGIVRIVRPCERDARAPMRAGRPRTHASGTPAHPCERDARAPMRARCPRTHAGGTPAHPGCT